MVFLSSISRITPLILFNLFFIILRDFVRADPPYQLCAEGATFPETSSFQKNLQDLLSSLSSNASLSKFYKASIGNDLDTVYGLFFCYDYVEKDDCVTCINAASQDIQKLCQNTKEAVVWEENCQLRYSNQNFFGHLDVNGNINQTNPKSVSDPKRLQSVVNSTLHNISNVAAFSPSSRMYATQEVSFSDIEKIYALVQCTRDLSPDECNTCLETAISNISSCCYFYRGARLLSRSCYLRYEFYPFYQVVTKDNGSIPLPEHGDQQNKWMVVVLTIGSATVLIALIGFCIYCLVLRNQTKNSNLTKKGRLSSEEVQLPEIDELSNTDNMHRHFLGRENLDPQEFPFIPMESIKAATDDFSVSNKLGQGGFGPVYKGILPSGEEIAVKRLSTTSDQGLDEFINEVLLIFKLQHKNLVRLLGFCVQGEEKLVVYEYMCNSSLDFFLNDQSKRALLNWSLRLDIINGIARGMLYLHQDSRLRIIHRDLKPSNVLLDKDMNPKISDFGMARIFGDGDCQDNRTAKIVGTYGYIAPEFAMEGVYSIKSDVFSFGVLLLEIITGKRNAGFPLSKSSPSLLSYAWQLWNEGRGKELMDPVMPDTCCLDDFLRCMYIGLLCVQQDAHDRPTMSSVVIMLKSETITLSQPERPAYSVGRLPDHQKTCYNNLSVNDLTVSNIHPR